MKRSAPTSWWCCDAHAPRLAVDGRRPQIVISDGLVDTLSQPSCRPCSATRPPTSPTATTGTSSAPAPLITLSRSCRSPDVVPDPAGRHSSGGRRGGRRGTDQLPGVVRSALLEVTRTLCRPAVAAFLRRRTVVERLDALDAAPPPAVGHPPGRPSPSLPGGRGGRRRRPRPLGGRGPDGARHGRPLPDVTAANCAPTIDRP